ncbi:hypothetical protein HMPREF3191_00044 [Veillonellaceae bacterium DNF00626]|nr:hypothetical protein HMPREF3191_00044 [Veillonellaceae bacterium DNF00626]
MKQLFLFFFLLLSIPFNTSAISLQEIQNNPQKYQLIRQTSKYAAFVDASSIESLRDSPPYYTLKCKAYMVNYLRDFISSNIITVSYNSSYRDFNLRKRKISELGIYVDNHSEDFWFLNGNYRLHKQKSYNDDPDINSLAYQVANYLFYKTYNEYYGPQFGNTLY